MTRPSQNPHGRYPPKHGRPAPPQVYVNVNQSMQVGRSVTRPVWTIGDTAWLVCTAGLAWPWI